MTTLSLELTLHDDGRRTLTVAQSGGLVEDLEISGGRWLQVMYTDPDGLMHSHRFDLHQPYDLTGQYDMTDAEEVVHVEAY